MLTNTEVQCIIFDCDGTLVDSEYLSHQALQQQLFEETGLSLTAELLCEQYRGAKLALILDELKTQFCCEVPEGFVLRYRERVEELFTSELHPMPGAHDILSQIQLPVCVASSGPLKKIQTALSVTGLLEFFNDRLFSSYDINSWKPEPDLFIHAADKMGFSPSQCLVVEDSLTGIQAARAAGMAHRLYDPHGIYQEESSDIRISHLSQLLTDKSIVLNGHDA